MYQFVFVGPSLDPTPWSSFHLQVKHSRRDWKKLGQRPDAIIHSPEGGEYWAVAVNNNGLLAVTDEGNKCVHLLTKEGALVRSIGKGVICGDLLSGVAFDLKGNVWVTDSENNKVVKLSQNGRLLQTIARAGSNLSRPRGVSVGPDGLIYICDNRNHRVTVHNEDGKFMFDFGSFGSGPGCFDRPGDIAFGSDGQVYVSDEGNGRISVWSTMGTFVRDFGTTGPGLIAGTCDKHLVVISYAIHKAMVYTLEGERVHMFDGKGYGGTCVDDSNEVYVADRLNRRVLVF